MAAVNDCTADRAEAMWTAMERVLAGRRSVNEPELQSTLGGIQAVAVIAMAHQLERIADKLESIEEMLCGLADLPFTVRPKA